MTELTLSPHAFFTRRLSWIVLVVMFLTGIGIRLYDLTDLPLDFHPTRQIRAAIIARGMYYQMDSAVDPQLKATAYDYWQSLVEREPQFLERLVAITYVIFGGETLWVSRIYTTLAWILGGWALFSLARRMVFTDAALVSLAFYLFLPFSVMASRSFQPDPIMVMWILFAALALYRWLDTPTWKWAVLTGIFGGLAILVKVVAAFPLAGMAVAVILQSGQLKHRLRDAQVWVVAAIMGLPSIIYYLFIIRGASTSFIEGSTLAVLPLITSPSFYVRWLNFLGDFIGLSAILVGLGGVLISRPSERSLLAGLWVGYGLYGLAFSQHIITHNYYSLPLVPIVALSIAPVAGLIMDRLGSLGIFWKVICLGVMLLACFYPVWVTRSILAGQNYQGEAAYWQEVGNALPQNSKAIALTQDYGLRLMYFGWRKASLWPVQAERNLSALKGKQRKAFVDEFTQRTQGRSYFLITALGQLNSQPTLKAYLSEHYPVYAKGTNYLIYDLTAPTAAP
jgi:4-amino-4-deoxy-L-arabinose transferase-like glycosyltransferase